MINSPGFRHGSTVRERGPGHGVVHDDLVVPVTSATAAEPRLPGAARAALAGRVRRGGATGRAGDRGAGELRRALCGARRGGEIRCPNYAYERVFLHMFPGRSLTDLGFAPRSSVRGRGARELDEALPSRTTSPTYAPHETDGAHEPYETQDAQHACGTHDTYGMQDTYGTEDPYEYHDQNHEESDVQRRAFMTGGTATVAAASLGPLGLAFGGPAAAADRPVRRVGEAEAGALEEAVRQIRLLDDRHGADGLYRRAAAPLRAAYSLLDAGATRRTTAERLHSGAGELAISVGWLAHDSGRFGDARSHYAEALATARVAGDPALEAHAFCNTSFLARDAGRPREAVRAAQAAQRVARPLGSARLLSLLAMREAGGWAGLADRTGCEQALARAHALFDRGPCEADPEWMSFYGAAELAGLEAQCWSTLGDWPRAAHHARRAARLQDPHFTRNIALYTAELADDLARASTTPTRPPRPDCAYWTF